MRTTSLSTITITTMMMMMMMPVATAQIAITTTNSNNNNQQQGPVYIKRPQQLLQGQKLQTQSFGESTDGFVDGPFPSGSTLNTLYSYRGNGKGIPGIFRTGREDNGQTSGALIFPTTNGGDSVDGPTGSNRNENENESTNENGGAAGLLLQLQQYQEEKNNEEAGATMTSTTGSTTLITRPIATGTIPITTTTTAPATTTAATPATNTVTLTSANGNTLTEGSTAKLGNLRKRKGATTLTMTQSMVVLNQDEEKDEP